MVVPAWVSFKKYRAMREKYMRDPPPPLDGFGTKSYVQSTYDGRCGLLVKLCSEENPCPALVTLYAKFGLHRYNLLNRTNFGFIRVLTYNYLIPRAASVYFITFSATDPKNSEPRTFQTKVDEHGHSTLARTCYIARLVQDETQTNPNHRTSGDHSTLKLPKWPPQNPFNRFYLVEESELARNDWIRLYLELSIAITRRSLSHHLSDVKILKVAIDTKEEEWFNAKNATVYIHFKDPCEARVAKDVDRVAIVRRNYNDHTGCFSFAALNQSSAGIDIAMPQDKGKNQSSAGLPMPEEKGKNGGDKFIRLLGVRKRWLLSSPKRHRACKNRNRGLARGLL